MTKKLDDHRGADRRKGRGTGGGLSKALRKEFMIYDTRTERHNDAVRSHAAARSSACTLDMIALSSRVFGGYKRRPDMAIYADPSQADALLDPPAPSSKVFCYYC